MPDRQRNAQQSPETEQQIDSQLVQDAKQGDQEAFGQLYERHAEAIFRFIFSNVGDRLDAEDLTEEVFLSVWRSLPRYRDRGVPFSAYLYRVARNAIIDHYRRSGRQRHSSLEAHALTDDNPGPGEVTTEQMEYAEVRGKLMQLRDDYRTVLSLRFLVGMSPGEIANVMGKSSGAVRVIQHRALSALRELLEE